MDDLSRRAARVWNDVQALDRVLEEGLVKIPFCRRIYAVNKHYIQVTSSVSEGLCEPRERGRDLSRETYFKGPLPYKGCVISPTHISPLTGNQCLSVIRAVRVKGGRLLGFLVADFDLQDLPLKGEEVEEEEEGGVGSGWHQFKGDPAIRTSLFQQQRVPSALDERLDEVLYLLDEMICNFGVFHLKIHFSSSRATLWTLSNPYAYQLHDMDELLNPDIFLAYERHPYPEQAKIRPESIQPILDLLKKLRDADETIYLRSASLNIMNALVGLTFSCDGSHYMPAEEFLEKGPDFWFGALRENA